MSEIRCNEITIGAAKVVNAVCPILSYVDLPIWIRDLIYDIHRNYSCLSILVAMRVLAMADLTP